MICNPRVGSTVRVHYAKRRAAFMVNHGRTGIVRIASRGPGPRNHGIDLGGTIIAVPCGNIRPAIDEAQSTSGRAAEERS